MASRHLASGHRVPSGGSVRRVLCAVAGGLAATLALAVVAAPAAAAPVGDGRALGGREFGVPLALFAGVGIFLVVGSQAGNRASKLKHAPLRPDRALRFPEGPG